LEKVKTKKTNFLTRNSSAYEITLLAYVILKHVIEGKIEGRMEVKGRRGIKYKQLLDDLKKKEKALQRRNTKSQCVENSLCKKLWTSHTTD